MKRINSGQVGRPSDAGVGYARPKRQFAALAGSVVVHAVVFAMLIFVASRAVPHRHRWMLAYVIDMGSAHCGASAHSGGALQRFDPGPVSPPEEPIAIPLIARGASRIHQKRHMREAALAPVVSAEREGTGLRLRENRGNPRDEPSPAAGIPHSNPGVANSAVGDAGAFSGTAAHGARTGSGFVGRGNDASGDSRVRADYGYIPAPLYPARSRRRGEQGTVTLHVLIAADGAVERVELLVSSGFRALDETALETVRRRWKFIPARRDGVAVESWTIVPIHFMLRETSN